MKNIEYCPSCEAEIKYNDILGLYQCTECEWEKEPKPSRKKTLLEIGLIEDTIDKVKQVKYNLTRLGVLSSRQLIELEKLNDLYINLLIDVLK